MSGDFRETGSLTPSVALTPNANRRWLKRTTASPPTTPAAKQMATRCINEVRDAPSWPPVTWGASAYSIFSTCDMVFPFLREPMTGSLPTLPAVRGQASRRLPACTGVRRNSYDAYSAASGPAGRKIRPSGTAEVDAEAVRVRSVAELLGR